MKTNIILTGFMGTGKSTIGRRLAKRINYNFIDTDNEIEKRCGKTITTIFKESGEAAFRQLESELVAELANKEGFVIATGGGLVLNPDNVANLNKTGDIICLTASAAEILARVSNQRTVRPLLQTAEPLEKVKELLEQRKDIYSQFKQLSTSGQSIDQLVDSILELTNKKH